MWAVGLMARGGAIQVVPPLFVTLLAGCVLFGCDRRVEGLTYLSVHSQRCAGRSLCVAVLRSFGLVSLLVRPAVRAFPLRSIIPLSAGSSISYVG